MDSAKKRVVLAITLAEPGGAQSFLIGFARWLAGQGFDVTVMAGDGTWLEERCRKDGIAFRRLAHMGRSIRPWRDLRGYLELKRVFRELKPDAIHLNSSKMGFVGSLAAKKSRVVYRIGGWVFLEPLSPLTKALYRWIEKTSARWKDVIVCVHPGDVAVAEKLGFQPRERIIAAPNGVDLPSFDAKLKPREEARHSLGINPTVFVFGTVANFYPAKDLPRYLEACAAVAQQRPDARFLIIGEGAGRAELEAKRQSLGLTNVFLLPGARDDAATLLKGLDAFVLPSAKEGMSWALLEAMAAGLPCIATDVGAAAWMLRDGAGWIVPPQDPGALAQAMLAARNDQNETARRSALARRTVEERFPLAATYEGNLRALFG